MNILLQRLWNDERAFIVSAELVLIATVAVLGLIVGLSEVSNNVNQELEDVGAAIACIQQTFEFDGAEGHTGFAKGSYFYDYADYCGGQWDIYAVRTGNGN